MTAYFIVRQIKVTDPLFAKLQYRYVSILRFIPEYFEYAPCIRERISSSLHCSGEYEQLIGAVEGGGNSTDLCCGHHGFKECLVAQSASCGSGRAASSEAADYAKMFLDKALGFVAQECNRAG